MSKDVGPKGLQGRAEWHPVVLRIRQRRRDLGLSLSEVARRAGVRAPSFIHSIENGQKVPSEEIARMLAQALGDDERLYSAWARTRGKNWKEALFDQEILRDVIRGPSPPRLTVGQSFIMGPLASEAALEDESMEAVDVFSKYRVRPEGELELAPSFLVKIPVLPEAADPDQKPEPLEVLRFDPRLLPLHVALVRPFVYRLSHEGVVRVPEQLRPSDLVLVTRSAWPVLPEEVYAVRIAGRVALSRAAWEDGALWAVHGERGAPGERTGTWQALGTGTPPAALVGRVALVVRGSGRRA